MLVALTDLAGHGGIQHVNAMTLDALRAMAVDVRCHVLHHVCASNAEATAYGGSRVGFLLGVYRELAARPALLIVDHARVAGRTRLFQWSRSRSVVFAYGVEVWRYRERAVARALRRADTVLAISDFTAQRVSTLYGVPAARLRRVHLGVRGPTAVRSVGERRPEIVVVGRMSSAERYKGHEELIGAWSLVTRSHPDARLRLVGTGDDLPRLRHLAQRCGVADYVYFEGPASEERKLALIGEARGLALLSTDEGFGLAWTEAMAAGTPVLGLRGTVAEELFSHGEEGFLLRNRGQEEIAAAVGYLLSSDGAWNLLSRRARDRWARSFTRDDCVRRLSGEFARLLEVSHA